MDGSTGKQGLIFDIKRYSINDGPGIRVTVFFKGCPLSCAWCHNPESQSFDVQKLYTIARCMSCNSCVQACPNQALSLSNGEGIKTKQDLCDNCGVCAEVCPSKAVEMCGKEWSAELVMKEIRKEMLVMKTSGGGVTFSGGEPLANPELLVELLSACKAEEIHTAVDTSGFAKKDILLKIATVTDLFLYDLKLIDPERHKKYTGASNTIILENLKELSKIHENIILRVPLIERINTDEESIKEMIDYIVSLPGLTKHVNLLPYHSIAAVKYARLGGTYNHENLNEPGHDRQLAIQDQFNKAGINAVIGG
ncbi:MAG: glycyl-radical enzyme activating protein [Bacteroidetes bacterium]|nr:glycyl-radical enzyme activating protein [Bacteroidota bacterium]